MITSLRVCQVAARQVLLRSAGQEEPRAFHNATFNMPMHRSTEPVRGIAQRIILEVEHP